jgi:galactose oxidase
MLHSTLVIVSYFLLFQTSAAINACPNTDTVYTGSQGIRYRVCTGTDLVGPTEKLNRGVRSARACAQLCDESLDCFKAVYDTKMRQCHFKATTGLKWQANTQFDVIQAEQINIARCPSAETTYKSGDVSATINSSRLILTEYTEFVQDLSRYRPSWCNCAGYQKCHFH